MTSQRHARVKELFLQARNLNLQDRKEFLRRECGDDATLSEEVTSLLEHDSSRTIMVRPQQMPARDSRRVPGPRFRFLNSVARAASRLLQQVFGTAFRRLAVFSMGLAALVVLALWTNWGMWRSAQSIAAAELATILNADVKALELWIEEKKQDVQLLSSRPELNNSYARQRTSCASPHLTDYSRAICCELVCPSMAASVLTILPQRIASNTPAEESLVFLATNRLTTSRDDLHE